MADLFTAQGIVDRIRDTILVDASGDYFTNDTLLDLVFDAGREVAGLLRIPRETESRMVAAGSTEIGLDVLYGARALNISVGSGTKANTVEVLDVRVGGLSIPRGSRDEVEFWQQAPAAAFPRVWNADIESHVQHTIGISHYLRWGPQLAATTTFLVTMRFMDDNLPYRGAPDLYGPNDYSSRNTSVENAGLWWGAFRDWHWVPMYLAAAKAKEMELDGEGAAYYRGLFREGLAAFANFLGEPLAAPEGVAA